MAHVQRSGAYGSTGVTMHDARFNKILKTARAKLRPVSRQRDVKQFDGAADVKRFDYVQRDAGVTEAGRRWLAAGDVFAHRRGRVETSTQRPQRKSSPRNQRGNVTACVSWASW